MIEKQLTIPKNYHVEPTEDGLGVRVIAEPFERGFGTTIGNSLRRVLLTSLEGSAVTAVCFTDVPHEFSAISGVYEDTTDIVLNLKRCQIRLNSENSIIFTFEHSGEGTVTAGMLFEGQEVDVFNPDHVIFTSTQKDTEMKMEIKVDKGRGFKTSDVFELEHADPGVMYLDASFSPVIKVNYEVQDSRVGQMTDYDRLHLDIWTNGAITPVEALRQSAEILIEQFDIFAKEPHDPDSEESSDFGENAEMIRLLSRPIDEIELGARATNCFKAQNISQVGHLVILEEAEVLDFPNFGKKSYEEVKQVLDSLKLHIGMPLDDAVRAHFSQADDEVEEEDADAGDAAKEADEPDQQEED